MDKPTQQIIQEYKQQQVYTNITKIQKQFNIGGSQDDKGGTITKGCNRSLEQ